MMSESLLYTTFVTASVAYAGASIGYFVLIGYGSKRAERWAARLLVRRPP